MFTFTDLQVDAAIDLAITTAAAFAIYGVIAAMRKYFERPPVMPRTDRRIPQHEHDLMGPDYRHHVAGYFSEKFIADTRRRMAIYSVTGADPLTPEKRDRTADTAGPETHMEGTHAK